MFQFPMFLLQMIGYHNYTLQNYALEMKNKSFQWIVCLDLSPLTVRLHGNVPMERGKVYLNLIDPYFFIWGCYSYTYALS